MKKAPKLTLSLLLSKPTLFGRGMLRRWYAKKLEHWAEISKNASEDSYMILDEEFNLLMVEPAVYQMDDIAHFWWMAILILGLPGIAAIYSVLALLFGGKPLI